MGWTVDPRKFKDQVQEDHLKLCKAVALEIDRRLVNASPVGNPDLWKVNAKASYKRETYNLFADALGARRKSAKALRKAFPNADNGGYVGGRFRSNWIASVGSANESTSADIVSANDAIEQAAAAIATAKFFPVIYIQDNLPYSKRLNEGHSSQAPAGFVESAIDGVVDAVNRGAL